MKLQQKRCLAQGASSSATEALLARQDGCVHAGAGRLLQEAGEADGQPAADTPDKDAHVLRACRRILLQLTMLKVFPDGLHTPHRTPLVLLGASNAVYTACIMPEVIQY